MAVLPVVQMIFAADEAVFDLADEVWVVRHPRTITYIPTGRTFPFREAEMAVYIQLSGGLGAWEICVELRQRRDNGEYRFVGTGATTRLDFAPIPRLVMHEAAFTFRQIPFREEGLYEFRVLTRTDDGYQALDGPVAELRVLDRRDRL